MRRGRCYRSRKQRRTRQVDQGGGGAQADCCGQLRKWMVAQTSKADLATTLDLVPFCFPDTGRGLRTKRPISAGSVIVSVPQSLLVSPSTALSSPVGGLVKRWKGKITPHQLLTLFLLLERSKGSNSQWHPFISSLPADYTLPQYFSAEELNALPPHVYLAADRTVQRTRLAHRQTMELLSDQWRDCDCERLASWEVFRWAWCSVSSRAVFLQTQAGTQQLLDLSIPAENCVALCPYLDLLNHSSTARVRAGLNEGTGRYEIVTEDACAAHQQVFISYGPHDNATLFLHYGFTLPHNVHNAVHFSVDDFVELRETFHVTLWEQKQDVLRKHALHRDLTCSVEGVSWNLMCALKILTMNWQQLQRAERVVMGEEVSGEVELSAHAMAGHLLRQALRTQQHHLAKLPQGWEQSPHLSIAHTLLTDDIHMLTLSLQALT